MILYHIISVFLQTYSGMIPPDLQRLVESAGFTIETQPTAALSAVLLTDGLMIRMTGRLNPGTAQDTFQNNLKAVFDTNLGRYPITFTYVTVRQVEDGPIVNYVTR